MSFMETAGSAVPGSRLATVRAGATHLDGELILALAQVHDMSQQTVRRPLDIAPARQDLHSAGIEPGVHPVSVEL
jgi:hypothetical protein